MGPRREALKERRAQTRKRLLSTGTIVTVVAVLAAVGGVALFATNRAGRSGDARPIASPSERDTVTTTLVFGTQESESDPEAVWLTLIAYDRQQDRGAVIYIPAHAAVEVPGRGLQGVGSALASGGSPLLLVSTENLLGIEIDSYLELSDNDAELLFEAIGPVSVNVPEEVRVSIGRGRARILFTTGLQRLSPNFLTKLLFVRGQDSDDVELGLRHTAFWDALFDAFANEPQNLGAAVRSAGGALAESDTDPGEIARLLTALAELDSLDRTIAGLPVSQVSVGESELYSVDPDQVADFISDTIDVASGGGAEQVRVQVLNGNGVPGIGQEVAERLVGAGFRVVLTGNARRLNYEKTLLITYDDTEQDVAIAERARRLLGVGEFQVSVQEQGIVDLTIVVGRDFLRTR
ncbi:MAG TPA: LCP family protein [Actinomycetota bacterium]|nr:LCP family protein [Actinomycetota bacterium]